MKNETDYQSIENCYYESTGILKLTVQRRMDVELTHYSDGESKTTINITDCLTDYKWTGTLSELINQLVRNVKVPEDVNP